MAVVQSSLGASAPVPVKLALPLSRALFLFWKSAPNQTYDWQIASHCASGLFAFLIEFSEISNSDILMKPHST